MGGLFKESFDGVREVLGIHVEEIWEKERDKGFKVLVGYGWLGS